ncbi:MAG: MoaD/ThiS family protein [Desulfurococcaceae archaeon]|jgi:molybdopterin converting factor small subunit|nr:MoaD/ThiS family protein [Desulfurococcaceae archaeon]
MVKVRLYGSLKEALGRSEVDITVSTVKELLDNLSGLSPKLRALIERGDFIVLVNDRPLPTSRFGEALGEGDRVDIMPVISGGLRPLVGSTVGGRSDRGAEP